MTEFDEDLKTILDANWNTSVIDKPKIYLTREARMIDLQYGNFIVIEPTRREDEFFGIGAVEYIVRARCSLMIRTGTSVDDANKMLSVVHGILRDKSNWSSWQNVRVSSLESLMEREKKIYSYVLEVEGIKFESI